MGLWGSSVGFWDLCGRCWGLSMGSGVSSMGFGVPQRISGFPNGF